MGNQMIDWRALLFWQNTDTDTAGCLSAETAEWYMRMHAQNKAQNTHTGKVIAALSPLSMLTHYQNTPSISKDPFCLKTVDHIHTCNVLCVKLPHFTEVKIILQLENIRFDAFSDSCIRHWWSLKLWNRLRNASMSNHQVFNECSNYRAQSGDIEMQEYTHTHAHSSF